MTRLQKNINYNLLVTSITQNRKAFEREGVMHHVHDIYFKSENGEESKGEYVTRSPVQTGFKVGEKTCFVVSYDGGKGVEIELCAMPSSAKENAPDMIVRDFVNVSGDSHNFAMRYATDLMCAMISAGTRGFESAKDVEEMKKMAGDINKWLIDPQPPLPF